MDMSDGQVGALMGPSWSKEELDEMLWLYRTDDSTPWNIAVLVISLLVLVLNVFLLGRSIMANRNLKMNPQDKQAVETKSSFETATNKEDSVSLKDNNSMNILKETLLSKNQDPKQAMTELKERPDMIIFPESSEAEI